MSPAGVGLDEARRWVGDAERVVVVTGAGVSAESGVPTFRGEGGLWKDHRPEELATPGAFRRDPRLVWEWYEWRRGLVAECDPNPGHRAVASLQVARDGVRVVTQNVDGLHRKALDDAAGGATEAVVPAPERPILELHGSLFRVRCTACRWRAERRRPVDASSDGSLPRCPDCGALVRPDVVWFGESLDREILEAAFDAARSADVCVVAGTSAVVQPAASVPLATREAGGRVVEVNPAPTPLSASCDVVLRGPAGTLLPRLLAG